MRKLLICAGDGVTTFLTGALPKGWTVSSCACAGLAAAAEAFRPDVLLLDAAEASPHSARHLLELYHHKIQPFILLFSLSGEPLYASTHRVVPDPEEGRALRELLAALTRLARETAGENASFRQYTGFEEIRDTAERSAALSEILQGVSSETFRRLRARYALDLAPRGYYLMLITRPARDYYNDFTENRDIYLMMRYLSRLGVLQILRDASGGELFRINTKTDLIIINDADSSSAARSTAAVRRLARALHDATDDGLSAHFLSRRVRDAWQINDVYRELARLRNYKLFWMEKDIVTAEDLRGRPRERSYSRLHGCLDAVAAFTVDTPDEDIEKTLRVLFLDYLSKSLSLTEYFYCCSSLNIMYDEFCRRYSASPEGFMIPVEYQWWNGIGEVCRRYIDCWLTAKRKIAEHIDLGSGATRTVARYIERNYQLSLGLEELAALTGLHPAYLSQKFRRETGQTITEYITGCRIARARELLTCTNATVSEIGTEVGFPDVKYFSRVFTKLTGMSPKHWRDMYG